MASTPLMFPFIALQNLWRDVWSFSTENDKERLFISVHFEHFPSEAK